MPGDQRECVFSRMLNKNGNQIAKCSLHDRASKLLNHTHTRPERNERESPAHCYINDGDATIRTVHCSEDVQIAWQKESAMKRFAKIIGKVNSTALFRRFEQKYGLTKNFAQVGAVDLIDVQKVVARWALEGV